MLIINIIQLVIIDAETLQDQESKEMSQGAKSILKDGSYIIKVVNIGNNL